MSNFPNRELPRTASKRSSPTNHIAPDALAGLEAHLRGDPRLTPATGWYPPDSEEVDRRWGALGQVWRDLARAMFSKR